MFPQTMVGSAESVAAPGAPTPLPSLEELARSLRVSPEVAARLQKAGLTSAEAVRDAPSSALEAAGVPAADVERLHRSSGAPAEAGKSAASVDSDEIVQRWAGTVRRPDRTKRHRVGVAPKESQDVLRKWVEGDDRAMEDWIRASEPGPAASVPVPSTVPAGRGETGPGPRPADAGPMAPVLEREETVVRWLTGLLDRVKSDQFDPSTMIQEAQDLHRQLYDERAKRKQLEDEVEHVKRGSIAVIKYVRSREAKEREIVLRTKDDEIAELKLRLLALEGVEGERSTARPSLAATGAGTTTPRGTADAVEKATREVDQRLREEFADREHEFIERETELRRRIVQLEGDVRNLSGETERVREREALLSQERGPIANEVAQRLEEVSSREKDLVARENELRKRFEEIRINSEELERRRSPLEFKERELAAYETQLQTRRQALDIEARRLEELRREVGASGVAPGDEARRMEDLRHQLSEKEAELRGRESLLTSRMQELERMAGFAADAEAKQIRDDVAAAAQEVKVRSGVRRLDDLLYGGFPVDAQILINGPAHTGKDVLARMFSVEGLRIGVPSIWVVTDKTHLQVRDDLAALYPAFPDAEKKGLIRYVDLYSRQVGSAQSSANVRLLSSTDKAVLEQLGTTVNGIAEELLEKFPAYRIVFESVSTITAYLDTAATVRFLQPFIGRRKLDHAVGYYVLESGMHSDSDLETLEHMVDGSINLKVEQMKTYLAVRGITEAQARSWVGYSFNKRSFNLGSFSLEHIR
jgi:KaiC/GvpD/RAD55 family RecA-like ATPase